MFSSFRGFRLQPVSRFATPAQFRAMLLAGAATVAAVFIARWLRRPRPVHEVLTRIDALELRQYPPLVVAETVEEDFAAGRKRLASCLRGEGAVTTAQRRDGKLRVQLLLPEHESPDEVRGLSDGRVFVRELGPRVVAALKCGRRVDDAEHELMCRITQLGLKTRGVPMRAAYGPLRRKEVWVELET